MLTNKIKEYRSLILNQFDEKIGEGRFVLKNTKTTQQVYVDHYESDGAFGYDTEEYYVWTFDGNSHYKVGTYNNKITALEKAILVFEEMKGVK